MKRTTKALFTLLAGFAMLFTSCGMPKNIVYFQDLEDGSVIPITQPKGITAKPNDELAIIVTSKDPELSAIFNLPLVTTLAGRGQSSAYNQQVATYTIDSHGDIDFPILGKIHIEGLTRDQIAEKIKHELVSRQLLSDPVVSVNFVNIYYSVTGEVGHPGRFEMDRDQITIIDAITRAGDLKIQGQRANVMVIRREGDVQKTYKIDLTDATALAQSPAYFIQQEDIIYVAPNTARARQSTVNGNNLTSYSFWLSLASVLTSMAVLIFK